MTNKENAEKIFRNGFNCAQSVLSSYCEKYGIDEFTAKKISCGFGAGCARQSLTCGAISGAIMVIGLKYGKNVNSDDEAKETTYKNVTDFSNKFREIYGSLNCYELLGCDLATEEGRNYFKDNNMFNNECVSYVKTSCNILDEMGF